MKSPLKTLQLLLVFGFAALAGCTEPAPTETTTDKARPSMDTLVSAAWLMEHLDDPDLVVLDATVIVQPDAEGNFRSMDGRAGYEAGHIPGAGFANLLGELSDEGAQYQFSLPSPEEFAAAMGALGVGDDSRVVLYDTTGMAWAARVWWMLRWIGFDQAALLDGGLNAWTAAGGELSTEPVTRAAQTLSVNTRPGLIADQDEVRASLNNESVRLIDALPEIHFRGEWTMYERPGHIPGATNIPTTSLFHENGRFRSDDELAALLGENRSARTITYCGGGIAASVDAFVLTRLGFNDVAVYDGSLAEWTADPDNPMDVVPEEFGADTE